MLLLALADLHGNHGLYEWLVGVTARVAPEAIVLAGDLLGYQEGFDTIEDGQRADAAQIVDILDRITRPVLYVMGNDDLVELDPRKDSIQSLHGRRVELGDLNFVGYQYSLPFMGGIFEKTEDGIRDDLKTLEPLVDDRTVLVTHSPAYGILDMGVLDLPAGSKSIGSLIERRSPLLHIHGHIHQEFGNRGRHFNVAAAEYKRAVLIDTRTMEHRVLSETGMQHD